MQKRSTPARPKVPQGDSPSLKGWQQIASFLGQTISVAQRWAKSGMPVKHVGRSLIASPVELNEWLGCESGGEPVHVSSQETDLTAELKRGLSYVRQEKAAVPGKRTKRKKQ
jgi:hypothetical protein